MMRQEKVSPVFLQSIPEVEDMKAGVFYVCEQYEVAAHLCACGCGFEVVTPLGDAGWSLEGDRGEVSLSPSIGNYRLPCQSHYFIRNNKIEWC